MENRLGSAETRGEAMRYAYWTMLARQQFELGGSEDIKGKQFLSQYYPFYGKHKCLHLLIKLFYFLLLLH